MDVFVSRPTKVEPNFEPGLAAFLTRLKDLGLAGHTLGATDYGSKSPLDQVIGILTKCSGAVILGYPQVRVDAGVVRGTPISAPMMLPTEWNHIEAGLAYARKLPLLVIHHVGVKRGIFDRGALNSFIFEIDLSQQAWALSPEIGGALQTWRDEVLGFKPTTEKDRGPTYSAILEGRNGLWTVQALGRRIVSPKPLEATYRESAECRVEDLTDYYVRISILASGAIVTVPLGDIVISFDDERRRPMMQLRSGR